MNVKNIFLKKIKLNNRVRIYGFLLFLISCVVFISLLFHNRTDLSLYYYDSSGQSGSNLNSIKSGLSAILIYYFGISSFMFSFILIYMTYIYFRGKSLSSQADRLSGFVLLMFTISILAGKNGGISGSLLSANLLYYFDKNAAFFILQSFMFISLLLIFRFSFAGFIHILNTYILNTRFLSKIKFEFKRPEFLNDLASFRGSRLAESSSGPDDLVFDAEYAQFLKEDNNDILKNFVCPEPVISEKIKSPDIKSEEIKIMEDAKSGNLPDLNLFENSQENEINHEARINKKVIKEAESQARVLEDKLKRFGVNGSVTSIIYGPVITLFEYEPHVDSKISKILALEDDLAMALETTAIRILAPIPGKSLVGFEIANKLRKNVLFSSIAKSAEYRNFSGHLPLVLGEDTVGNIAIADLTKMPHLLIAGSTGSGKSVALNAVIISLLCKCKPEDLKLILIDPKRLELASYANINHLLFPIVTVPKNAVGILKWVTNEMEKRYEKMALAGVKNIFDYNNRVLEKKEKIPFIVIIIDELADLMMTAGKEIEDSITRIAQMARASGIHMILATQRPSVEVITGLIKVNFPSRISFKVVSKVDSRIILDCAGAEKLLGKGDMLFMDSQSSNLKRIHGAYVSDGQIAKVVKHILSEFPPVQYLNLSEELKSCTKSLSSHEDQNDELYENIIEYLKEINEVSISLLQRKFKIGYNRSARVIDTLESDGYILPAQGGRSRKVVK